ncbi:hypothetical protein DH2020_026469 [Rehmannia glutinosa]|uniref:O-fucosyltransferase family protein n=1 Tax=Rehmannia glutinosa TaxID=99300 RepID=A0ABR0VWW0_REHGL
MAVDLRQVMAAFLTFSMFIMLGNMIKKDHIDPLLEPLPDTPRVQYDVLKISKPGMVKLSEIANAVAIARQLGATLALPDIRGTKLGEKRRFAEIYNVDKFIASLNGVVRVDKNPPAESSNEKKLHIVRVPNRVSEDYIASNIKPIFQSKRNLKIVTYFNSSPKIMEKENHQSNAYQCLATFESLKLQHDLQELADSMVGTLRSLSAKMNGRFIAIDLRVEMLGKKSCHESDAENKKCFNAEEIGEFLKKIGFHTDTTIYLTQTGWHSSLNALRNVFPNTFTKDAIMPADEKAKFMDLESNGYEKFIDYYMCAQGDVFVPAFRADFMEASLGNELLLARLKSLSLPRKLPIRRLIIFPLT